MILTLTFAAWCFGHLGDIAAQIFGWLMTPWGYSARHRKGFREPSDYQRTDDMATWMLVYSYSVDEEPVEEIVEVDRLTPFMPQPTYPAFPLIAAHEIASADPQYPAYDLPRRTLAPGWREDVETIPVAEMAGAR